MTPSPKTSPETCPHCHNRRYLLENVEGFVRGKICECFHCEKCRGRGHLFLEDDKGLSYLSECDCQVLPKRLHLLSEAGLPGKYARTALETYHPMGPSQKAALRYARDFVQEFNGGGRGLVFMGRPGVGKTHLAVGILKALILEHGVVCRFVDFFQLLSDIRYGYSQDMSEQAIINPYVHAPVLVIDELAKGRNTEWELTMLDQIISSRYNAADKTTLFTTNYLDQPEAGKTKTRKMSGGALVETDDYRRSLGGQETLQEKIGERIYSRLTEMCRFVRMKGEDYRQEMSRHRK